MNPSRIFILRPVATTLLMVAILLAGGLAYKFLPLSALPEVDYPTIEVQTFLPGASPEVMTSSVTAPLERQLGQMPGLNQMTSASSAGASVITLQFSLNLSLDVAEQEVQAAINAANNLLPSGSADAAGLRQGQPGRRSDLDACGHLQDLAFDRAGGHQRNAAGAETFATAGRRTCQHQRRPEAGHTHQIQSRRARRLWPQHRRSSHDDLQCQRQFAEGQFRRPSASLDDQRQRPNHQRRRLQRHCRRLPQWRAWSACRTSAASVTGPENTKLGALANIDSGDHPQHPSPAGSECDRGRGHDQAIAALAHGETACRGRLSRY